MWRSTGYFRILGSMLVVVFAVTGIGCVDSGGGDNSWRYGDAGTDASTGGPTETTFRLTNATDAPIRIQKFISCDVEPGWLAVEDGSGSVPLSQSGCPNCTCEEARNGACEPCAETLDCRPNEVSELAAGASTEYAWSGAIPRVRTVDASQCVEREVPSRGDTFQVSFCWSAERGPTGPATGLEDPTCETVEFEYGEQTTVEHRVEESSRQEPLPTTFVLKNQSGAERELYNFNACEVPEWSWISIHDRDPEQSGSRLRFETDCTTCNCDDVDENGFCAACEKACTNPELERFPDGSEKTYEFDGVAWKSRDIESGTCHEKRAPSAGEQLHARFCWGFPLADTEPVCEVVPFEYGSERVVHEIPSRE